MSIDLLDARHDQCRWIEPNNQQPKRILVRNGLRRAQSVTITPDVMVCGQTVQAGSSYCARHHAMVYVPVTASRAAINGGTVSGGVQQVIDGQAVNGDLYVAAGALVPVAGGGIGTLTIGDGTPDISGTGTVELTSTSLAVGPVSGSHPKPKGIDNQVEGGG